MRSPADQDFRTAFAPGEPQPEQDPAPECAGVLRSADGPPTGMATWVEGGPDSGYSVKRHVGITGRECLAYRGYHARPGSAHSYNIVLPTRIPVTRHTRLSYKIFPCDVSDGTALPAPGAHVALDLEFSDGSHLRDLGAVDDHGFELSARGHGESGVLFAGHWNSVGADIGAVAEGRTITAIGLDYERDGEEGTFAGWVDDIAVVTETRSVDLEHPADLVDIRRGTNSSPAYSRGNTLPAVALPHGFNFWAPVTDASSSRWLYHYQQQNDADNLPALEALALSHQSYPWGGDRHTFQVMPTTDPGLPNPDRRERALAFDHEDEIARPHHYSVSFRSGVRAEITPADHAAMLRFTFPSGTGQLIFDNITGSSGGAHWDPDRNALVGAMGQDRDRMFLLARFDRPVVRAGTLQTGRRTGYVRFEASAHREVSMRIATSRISIDQAEHNLDLEIPETATFDEIRDRARRAWDEVLGVISDVEGASTDQLVTLYSSLYRMSLYQNSAHENVATAERPRLRHASPFLPAAGEGTDSVTGAQVVDGTLYRSSGFWDTYRTTWPALALFSPQRTGELIQGVLAQFAEAGWFPTGMVGSCSDASFAEIHAQGVRNFDVEAAYDVLIKHATVVSDRRGAGRPGLERGIFLGYTPLSAGPARPGGTPDESLADALENYLGDFAIAAMARSLHEATGLPRYAEEHRYLLSRARNYVHLFDPATGFFQGRHADGGRRVRPQDYEPREWGSDYTETNGWGMAFSVPHDGRGLANLYGGAEGLAAKLDDFFAIPERASHPGSYGAVIHEVREAAGIQAGQWGLSNQPGFHIPYMYYFAGRPWAAHRIVRTALARQFAGSDIGQGYPGDEDTGSTSAWFVLSALGLYPLQVGTATFVLGSPLFRSVTIRPHGGQPITVRAPRTSLRNCYVHGVRVNGQPYERTWITRELLAGGAEIEFDMGPEPSGWGTDPASAPPSLTEDDELPHPLRDLTGDLGGHAALDRAGSDEAGSDEVGADEARTDGAAEALFDDTSETTANLPGQHPVVTWSFPEGREAAAQMYTLTSSAVQESPTSWQLHGSTDGHHWTLLDSREHEEFRWDRQTRPFSLSEAGTYRHYRWTFTGPPQRRALALAQLELLG